MRKNKQRVRIAGVVQRSQERTDNLLERSLSIVHQAFEPFEHLRESPDEPPPPRPGDMPEPRRRTR